VRRLVRSVSKARQRRVFVWVSLLLMGCGAPVETAAPTTVATTVAETTTMLAQSHHEPPPPVEPCPADQREPAFDNHFCGPAPRGGNGHGRQGTCNRTETVPPCAAGAVVDQSYDYTVTGGGCGGVVWFDGRAWKLQLPPPAETAPFPMWIRLTTPTTAGVFGPMGVSGLDLMGITPPACTR
jgi:hypothetical protein